MKNPFKLALAISLVGVGCSQPPVGALGNDALGITEFQTHETGTQLVITGVDANGATVGSAVLTLGQVSIPEEDLNGDGKRLDVSVREQHVEHQSVGHNAVTLPLTNGTGNDDINLFLQDPNVAPVLARWGINFTAPKAAASAAQTDVPYAACSYSFSPACGETSCAQDTSNYEYVCCASTVTLVNRACTFAHDPSNPCGTTGSGGCSVCWDTGYSSSCNAFTPFSGANAGAAYALDGRGPWCQSSSDCIGLDTNPGGHWLCQGSTATCVNVKAP